jgi:Predicted unusual protein kinase
MLGNLIQNANQKLEYTAAPNRLREMIAVLRRREIVYGMTPEKMRLILEDLGPTFVKLGQIMSLRPDFLPQDYCDELIKLQTSAKPLPFTIIKDILEEEYNQKWTNIFDSIDEVAWGSASIAQVHRAMLKDGSQVVIKVQRPGIYEVMSKDIVLLKRAASLLKVVSGSRDVVDFDMVLDEMWSIAKQEMNFLMEADHNDEFRNLNREIDYVSCPQVDRHLTTVHVLVMEYIDGIQIDKLDELKAAGYDIKDIGVKLGQNYVKQIIEDGYFHADPHPGNIWIRDGKIIWLDLGMMGRLSNHDRAALKQAVFALVNNDTYEMKSAVLALGMPKERINHTRLYEDIDAMMAQYSSMDFENLQLGPLARKILRILRQHKIAIMPGISMFARGVMTIEAVMRICCPDVNFVEIFAAQMQADFRKNFDWREEMTKVKREGYMLLRKSLHLPEQVSDILKMTMSGQTKVNLDLTGSEEPLRQVDKMINKLIIGIISSALLLGSSIICTTEMMPKIMEIPLLGVFGYLAALVLCGRLLLSIMRNK